MPARQPGGCAEGALRSHCAPQRACAARCAASRGHQDPRLVHGGSSGGSDVRSPSENLHECSHDRLDSPSCCSPAGAHAASDDDAAIGAKHQRAGLSRSPATRRALFSSRAESVLERHEVGVAQADDALTTAIQHSGGRAQSPCCGHTHAVFQAWRTRCLRQRALRSAVEGVRERRGRKLVLCALRAWCVAAGVAALVSATQNPGCGR